MKKRGSHSKLDQLDGPFLTANEQDMLRISDVHPTPLTNSKNAHTIDLISRLDIFL